MVRLDCRTLQIRLPYRFVQMMERLILCHYNIIMVYIGSYGFGILYTLHYMNNALLVNPIIIYGKPSRE